MYTAGHEQRAMTNNIPLNQNLTKSVELFSTRKDALAESFCHRHSQRQKGWLQ